jgi:BAI1-associated protein 3
VETFSHMKNILLQLSRIGKAIELDNLLPIDENTRLSTSAIDTVTIFYQILVFWQQLEWPDVQSAFTFVNKIIEVFLISALHMN